MCSKLKSYVLNRAWAGANIGWFPRIPQNQILYHMMPIAIHRSLRDGFHWYHSSDSLTLSLRQGQNSIQKEQDIYLLVFPVTWAGVECIETWIIGFRDAAWPLWQLVCVGNNKFPVFTCLGRHVLRRCFWFGGAGDTLCIGFIHVCNKVTGRIFLLGHVSLNSCHFGGFQRKWSKRQRCWFLQTNVRIYTSHYYQLL